MKSKVLTAIVLGCMLVVPALAAKQSVIEVEYSTGVDDTASIDQLTLSVELVPGSGVKTLIMEVPVQDGVTADESNLVVTPATVLPIGKTLNYVLTLVDVDGESVDSPAFPFKLTGRPVINVIRKN